jgi:integrase
VSVYQDKKRGRWNVAFMQGGRRVHRVCPPGTTRTKAVEYETKLRQETFAVDRLGQIPDHSLGAAILKYLEEGPQKWRRDLESKNRALAPYVIGKRLRDAADVAEAYKREQLGKLSIGTINRRLALLRRVANLAFKKWHWLEKPVKIEFLPGEQPRETHLTAGQVKALVRRVQNKQVKAACMIAAYAGLRSAEILGLQPADVRDGVIRVTTGKTGRVRFVPVARPLKPWLKTLPIGLHASTLSHAVADAMPGVRFHDLRHSAASMLINAGVDLYTVGKILGHTQPQTTKRYAHLQLETLRKAVRKLK